MMKYSDFGGGDMKNPYCSFCTDKQGNLLPKEQVQSNLSKFYLKQGVCKEEAERKALELMHSAPAWRKK
jgi:hypothetical protein